MTGKNFFKSVNGRKFYISDLTLRYQADFLLDYRLLNFVVNANAINIFFFIKLICSFIEKLKLNTIFPTSF